MEPDLHQRLPALHLPPHLLPRGDGAGEGIGGAGVEEGGDVGVAGGEGGGGWCLYVNVREVHREAISSQELAAPT
jgi:hypothetical protein